MLDNGRHEHTAFFKRLAQPVSDLCSSKEMSKWMTCELIECSYESILTRVSKCLLSRTFQAERKETHAFSDLNKYHPLVLYFLLFSFSSSFYGIVETASLVHKWL